MQGLLHQERLRNFLLFLDGGLFNARKVRGGERGQGRTSLTRTLGERLRYFHNGDWALLFEHVVMQPPPRRRAPPAHVLAHEAREIQASLSDRDIRRAIVVATGRTGLATHEVVLKQLPLVFPRRAHPRPPPTAPPPPSAAHIAQVRAALQHLLEHPARRRAPGPAGSRVEHWALCASLTESIPEVVSTLAHLALGHAPQCVLNAAASSRLIPVAKDADRLRPIAVGHAARRLVKRAVARAMMPSTQQA